MPFVTPLGITMPFVTPLGITMLFVTPLGITMPFVIPLGITVLLLKALKGEAFAAAGATRDNHWGRVRVSEYVSE